MKEKWYRSKIAKAVLVPVAIASMASALVSGFWMLSAGLRAENVPFEESEDFEAMVENSMLHVLSVEQSKKMLETDGKYDPEKPINIIEYLDQISGREYSQDKESDLEYTLGDLYEWGLRGMVYKSDYIIECEKPDGELYYYYADDFEKLVNNKKLFLEVTDSSKAEASYPVNDVLESLRHGYINPDTLNISVTDIDGEVVYTNVYSSVNEIEEKYRTVDGKRLLDAVNDSPYLREHGIQQIINDIDYVVSCITPMVDEYMSENDLLAEGNTNFSYIYTDSANGAVTTNRSEYADKKKLDENIKNLTVETVENPNKKYVVVYPNLEDFKTNMDVSAEQFRNIIRQTLGNEWDGVFAAAVDTSYPVQDVFYSAKQTYDENLQYINLFSVLGIVSLITAAVSFVWLTVIAGRRPEDEEIHLNWFDRWKTEIAIVIVILTGLIFFSGFMSIWHWSGIDSAVAQSSYVYGYAQSYRILSGMTSIYIGARAMATLIMGAALGSALFCGYYLSLVRRIKAKNLWKNSLIRMIGVGMGKTWSKRSLITKNILIIVGFILLNWIALLLWANAFLFFVLLFADAALIWAAMNNAIAKNEIRKGIEKIASGEINYRIPTEDMRGENLKMAEKVNEIGNGLNVALENVMKSERLKTDLITNVSHDIKTPLTSIINYIDLLKRENIQDEKIQKYLSVLEEKAQRLKTLTEDVVEASKASSGNIKLELMDVNFTEMIKQTEGEFREKMQARNLTVITQLPKEPVIIHVDGTRMWRVLANLYSNAAKYAMPGTRVYSELKISSGKAVFSLKNISEQPLNIPIEELKERFKRGDQARTGEGSGLGLSIAEDLVKLQGGKLNLYSDGDLFKAEIEFNYS